MGYKTADPIEVMELQKQGKSVIGISSGSPQYFEFNFTKEGVKEVVVEVVNTDIKEPPKLVNVWEKKKPGRPRKEK